MTTLIAFSPTAQTTEQILQTILNKMSGFELSFFTLGRENDNRMAEIDKSGRELGFQ